MVKVKTVSFKRTDYDLPPFMLEAVKKIADHFSVKRDKRYLNEFRLVFKRSKHWNPEKGALKQQLEEWKAQFTRNYSDRNKLANIIVDSFHCCKTKDEINKLRGALLEAFLIGVKGGFNGIDSREEMARGWGARVYLQNSKQGVLYNCLEHKYEGCTSRSTVDYGEWDGCHGQFYECKVSPVSIRCKEVKYMEHLKKELSSQSISHEVFFLCADSKLNVQIKLEEYGLGPLYKPLGIEDIHEMYA
ncbi:MULTISPECIES: hypothetical protein [Bacillus]|uniref:hypothetical protein n=1 Tax=Bacillus TaxID=1386 RepID=UPI0011BECC0F|nr:MULTISPECIES: hypothetical protein [Bacillus]MCY8401364.1 hypothetical protein [Bacillus haynesii]MCY8649007.1 hypothetical protein [Bacillus haynesii]MCY9413124.1 hypothetical protein [Bacillus haynesii]TWK86262.1 hypothetical protein CHCC20333_3304 [Bacillus paralicheniformis]